MARSISYHELRSNGRAVLRDVRDGETLAITDRGEVVAVLTPPPAAPRSSALRTHMAAGRRGCSASDAAAGQRLAR